VPEQLAGGARGVDRRVEIVRHEEVERLRG